MLKKIIAGALTFIMIATFAVVYKFTATKSPLFAFSDYVEVYALCGSFGKGRTVNSLEYSFVKNAAGESCALIKNDDLCAEEIVKSLGGEILFTEQTEYGVSYYAYSPKVKYKTRLYGKTVNVHVFNNADGVKIGLPIIYGSY